MEYKLENLIDIQLFKSLLNSLNNLYLFPSAIIDTSGKVLAATAWQEVCTCFHRANPVSSTDCQASDRYLSGHYREANPYLRYTCSRGLTDCAVPIIIGGKHLGNFFTGQFFLEEPDLQYFRRQAAEFGYDEDTYLEAVKKTPVFSLEQVEKYMAVLQNMVELVVGVGTKKMEEIENRKTLEESEERFKKFFNTAPDAIFLADSETGIILDANQAAAKLMGRPVTELIGLHQTQLHPLRNQKFTRRTFKEDTESEAEYGEKPPVENWIVRSDGTEVPVEIQAGTIFLKGRHVIQGVFRDITPRKKFEAELLANEKKYRTLTENLPDIVARFDKYLRHIYLNPTIEQITGIPVADFLGKTNEELGMPSEKVRQWNKYLQLAFESGKQVNFEFSYNDGDSARYFSALLVPEFGEGEQVESVLSVARDITEIRRTKRSLEIQRDISNMLNVTRDLNQALSLLLEAVSQFEGIDSGGIYLIDRKTGAVDLAVHRGFSEKFIAENSHYESDSMNAAVLRKGDHLFLDYADVLKQFNPSVDEEGIRSVAILPILHEGNPIACLNLSSHVYEKILDDDRIVLEAIASSLGGALVRIRTENQLKESEIKYKLAFQTSPDSININSMDGIYVEVNEGFSSIMGYTRDEVIGKSSLDLNIWAIPDDRQKMVEELSRKGYVSNFESVFRAKDGSLKTALMSANLISINDVPHILNISRDITERKISEIELLMAKEKAEENNRLKSAFLANLSHELRTPMNGILGFAELLDDDSLTAETRREYISVINDSGQSLLEVITNLMDISKIDSRQIESRYRAFNLNKLISEMRSWLRGERIIRENPHIGIETETPLTDDQCEITSDPGKIRHILSLLLNNAAKFTSAGIIRFGYSIEGNRVRFFVQDTGKGIAPEKQETIFERFRQEDETLSRKYGGVGLGLTIARGLVELMGGTIGVESEPGHGSTFWFEIPLF